MKPRDSSNSNNLPALHESPAAVSPLLQYIQYSEFKRILEQIASTIERNRYKSLAILSEYPSEGKTFLVSALALGYSNLLNKRVLIINTVNSIHDSLDLETVYKAKPRTFGGKPNRDPTAPTIDMISPHVDPNGDPSESSDFQIGEYIRVARDNYNLIISDTCALSAKNKNNVDPVVIARHSDTSILLTSPRSLERAKMMMIKARLAQWNISVMGMIHNMWVAR